MRIKKDEEEGGETTETMLYFLRSPVKITKSREFFVFFSTVDGEWTWHPLYTEHTHTLYSPLSSGAILDVKISTDHCRQISFANNDVLWWTKKHSNLNFLHQIYENFYRHSFMWYVRNVLDQSIVKRKTPTP